MLMWADAWDNAADYIAYHQPVDAEIMQQNRDRIAAMRNSAQMLRKAVEK